MYAKLSKNPQNNLGNYVSLKTDIKEHTDVFINAKDLFYSSENIDFVDPTYQADDQSDSKFGFKFLGFNDYGYVNKGHLYDVGQRRHYNILSADKAEWERVEGVNLWCLNKKVFPADRDRGSVTPQEVEDKMINPMIEQAEVEDVVSIISQLEPYWGGKYGYFEVAGKIVQASCDRLAKEGKQLDFDQKYLASGGFISFYIKENLESQGYILCPGFMEKIGMKSVNEKFREMQSHYKIEPTPEQTRRIEILKQAASLLIEAQKDQDRIKNFPDKDIWIFGQESEKSIFSGQYNENFVWISGEKINTNFAEALSTYLHELDHEHGNDYSTEFSYALTDSLKILAAAIMKYPEEFKQLADDFERVEKE